MYRQSVCKYDVDFCNEATFNNNNNNMCLNTNFPSLYKEGNCTDTDFNLRGVDCLVKMKHEA